MCISNELPGDDGLQTVLCSSLLRVTGISLFMSLITIHWPLKEKKSNVYMAKCNLSTNI
jgi:hypothetical protein